MAIAEERWDRAVALLGRARQVVLACHVDPDGDALGSMLALHRLLSARGVEVAATWGRSTIGGGSSLAVPPQYTFLPGIDALVPPDQVPQEPELFVAFDTATPERLGAVQAIAERAANVIVIDHHPSGDAFGDVALCDGAAAATAVLVDELVRRMGGTLDREMAICLYVGLITDTGRFQHPSTTPDVMEFAARLLSFDIDHAAINRQVWETKSFGYLKVLGRAMQRAQLLPEAGLAWTAVLQSDLTDLGITMAETEGMIDVLRTVEAAECALICKEQADGSWAASLRSKGRIDVGRLASTFRGGGHAFAAGFRAEGDLEDLVERVAWAVITLGEHDDARQVPRAKRAADALPASVVSGPS